MGQTDLMNPEPHIWLNLGFAAAFLPTVTIARGPQKGEEYAQAPDLKTRPAAMKVNGLDIQSIPNAGSRIASPDAIVDEQRRVLRLHFPAGSTILNKAKGAKASGQPTFCAASSDGRSFHMPQPMEIFGNLHFRVFRLEGRWYASAKGKEPYRGNDGVTPFQPIGNPFFAGAFGGALGNGSSSWAGDARHVAVEPVGDDRWPMEGRPYP